MGGGQHFDGLAAVIASRVFDFIQHRRALAALELGPHGFGKMAAIECDRRLSRSRFVYHRAQHFRPAENFNFLCRVMTLQDSSAVLIDHARAPAGKRRQPGDREHGLADPEDQGELGKLEIGELGTGIVTKDQGVAGVAMIAA